MSRIISYSQRRCAVIVVPILVIFAQVVFSQTLQEKLAQKPDFVPQGMVARDALVELATHYQIPMGIEWVHDSRDSAPILLSARATVEDLLNQILEQRPGYLKEINDGVVNVKQVTMASDKRNFLTIRLAEYRVRDVNVFGAEWHLRVSIRRTRHPEIYARGVNGGYGQPDRGDGFNISNISYRAENVTVRDVLNAIVRKNANSLWMVELNPQTMMRNEPFFAQRAFDRDVQTDFTWRIIPFRTSNK